MAGMKKKTKKMLLLLVVLVLVIAAYAVITLWPEKEVEQNVTDIMADRTVLIDMADDAVAKVEFKGPNAAMVLVREDGFWYNDDDRDFPVNQSYATSMANILAGASSMKTINEKPENLADYGLTEPVVWARVTDTEGNSHEIRVGLREPSGGGRYVCVDDEQVVYLAANTMATQFEYSKNQMIEKHSVPTITPVNICGIMVESPERTLEMKFDSENIWNSTGYMSWVMLQGFDDIMPANVDKINAQVEMYADFSLGECVTYRAEDPAQYGLDEANGTHLQLIYFEHVETGEVDESGNPVTTPQYYTFGLTFGDKNEDGHYYLTLDGTEAVYLMDAARVEPMINLEPYDFVHRLPGLVNIKDVDRVIIEFGGSKYTMNLTREMVMETDKDGNEKEEEVTHYFLEDLEVEKEELTDAYIELIGVAIDGLVDEEVAAQASQTPRMTITYERDKAGLEPIVTQFFEYNENFNRMSVNGVSVFRCNVRDVDYLMDMIEDLFTDL